jgi:hypothetical protein
MWPGRMDPGECPFAVCSSGRTSPYLFAKKTVIERLARRAAAHCNRDAPVLRHLRRMAGTRPYHLHE